MGWTALRVVLTVLAVASSLASSMAMVSLDSSVPGSDEVSTPVLAFFGFLAAACAAVMLVWRHRWPELVTGIALVPPLLLTADSLAALIALAALTAHRTGLIRWGGTALVYAATALAVWHDSRRPLELTIAGNIVGGEVTPGSIIGVLLIAAVFTAIPVTIGLVRWAREENARLAGEQHELRAEMARREERARIAREMHDVLGHRLSLLSLQAGALEVTTDEDAPAAAVARTVRTTAKQSLDDLRQVIGVLRENPSTPETAPGAAPPPQPTLADIPELIADARRAGLPVNATIMLDQAVTAPPQVATGAYRIMQEALTNVLRHSPGVPADVTVRGGPGVGLAIQVVNPLHPHPPASPGSGTGLTGVHERAILLGGRMGAGPTEQQVFVLQVWLPW